MNTSTCVNRSSKKGVKGKTPYERYNGIELNIEHLGVFGSVVCEIHWEVEQP